MAGGASLASRIGRPWGPLIRGSLTARLVVSLVALVIVTCAVLGFATYTVLSRQLMANFHTQLQEATSRAYVTCGNNPPPQTSTSAWTSFAPEQGPGRGLAQLRAQHPRPVGGHVRRLADLVREREPAHHRPRRQVPPVRC